MSTDLITWKVLTFFKTLLNPKAEAPFITQILFTSEVMMLPDADYVEISLEYVNNAA